MVTKSYSQIMSTKPCISTGGEGVGGHEPRGALQTALLRRPKTQVMSTLPYSQVMSTNPCASSGHEYKATFSGYEQTASERDIH